MLAVMGNTVGIIVVYKKFFVALMQSFGDAVGQTAAVFGVDLKAVDYQLHRMVFIAVELHAQSDFAQFAVNSDVEITLFAQRLEEFLVMTFTVFDQRSEDVDFFAVKFVEYQTDYAFLSVFDHRLAALPL